MRLGILVSCLTVLASGCGGDTSGRVAVYHVTGKVTLAGSAPLSGAMVSFAPTTGQPVAVGKSGDDGTFVLTTYDYGDGAAEGKFDVLISKFVPTSGNASVEESHAAMASGGGPPAAHGGGKKKAGEDKGGPVNPKYSKIGALTATVTSSGPNEFSFELEP